MDTHHFFYLSNGWSSATMMVPDTRRADVLLTTSLVSVFISRTEAASALWLSRKLKYRITRES